MNSSKADDGRLTEPSRPKSRWTGDRLLFLGVGVVLCLYALVSLLVSR